MGEDTDVTDEVRERLEEDSALDADSDGDSDPLFTTDRPDGEGEGEEDDQ